MGLDVGGLEGKGKDTEFLLSWSVRGQDRSPGSGQARNGFL